MGELRKTSRPGGAKEPRDQAVARAAARPAKGTAATRRLESQKEGRGRYDCSFPGRAPDFGGRVHKLEQESSRVRSGSKEGEGKERRGCRRFSSLSNKHFGCKDVMPCVATEFSK